MFTKYQQHGFTNRAQYLSYLAMIFNMPASEVWLIALELGGNEDFDMLLEYLKRG